MTVPGNLSSPLLATAAAAGAAGGVATKSLRFNGADQAYLARTFSSAGNTRTWTLSFWIKKVRDGGNWIFAARSPLNDSLINLVFNGNDEFEVGHYSFSSIRTARKYRDYGSWYHIVLAVDTTQATASNRIRVYTNGVEETSFTTATYPSQNTQYNVNTASLHTFAQSASDYGSHQLADIYHIDGSQLDPTSFGAYDDNGVWQAAAYSGTFGTNGFHLKFDDVSSAAALGTDSSGNSNTFTVNNLTHAAGVLVSGGKSEAVSFDGVDDSLNYSNDSDLEPSNGNFTLECFVYRHTGQISVYYGQSSGNMGIRVKSNGGLSVERRAVAFDLTGNANDVPENQWSHIAVTRHAGTMRTYVNGVNKFTVSNTQTYTGTFSSGKTPDAFDKGAVASLHFVKGTALYTGSGSFTPPTTISSHANTKLLCCQSASSATAATVKPSGVTISTSGSPTAGPFPQTEGKDVDALFDAPTNGTQSDTGAGGEVSGNYCTWNALDRQNEVTLANGNLDATFTGSNGHGVSGTIAVSSGKFYWEVKIGANTSLGIHEARYPTTASRWTGGRPYSWGYAPNGQVVHDSSYSNYGTAHTNGDIVGVAFDADNGKLYFSLNGTWQNSGNPATGTNPAFSSLDTSIAYVPHIGYWTSPGTNVNSLNAGQRAFAYSAPSGFKALCTTNLATPTIADGSNHFEAKIWSGDGSSSRSFTDYEFSPDMIWGKSRSHTNAHWLMDIVRGAGKRLEPSANDTEDTPSGIVTSFDSNGFTMGSNTENNGSGRTYVGWAWDAGSSTASNTDGNITSNCRANQTAGISVLTYTGSGSTSGSVGHGLNTSPGMVWVKARSASLDWKVAHSSLAATHMITLSENYQTNVASWNGVTNSVFYPARSGDTYLNSSGTTYAAFCFAPVSGFSAFGAYEGTGTESSAPFGPFQHTGFRPRFLLLKNVDSTNNWWLYDTAREPSNPAQKVMQPNVNFTEFSDSSSSTSGSSLDILSNGFRVRTGTGEINGSGQTIVWAAFAENPFQANGGLAR